MHIAWINGLTLSVMQKGMTTMEYYPSNVPKGKDVDGSVRTQCVITIRGGSSRNRLLLLCDSYREGIALLEQAMIQLDSIEIGRLT